MTNAPTNTTVPATLARRARFIILLLLIFAGPLGLYFLLRAVPTLAPFIKATTFHFWIVSGAALLGLVAAAAVLRASLGRDDIWVFFVGLGFLSIAGVFLLHSLATENIILGDAHPSFSTSPATSLAAGAVFFGLSAIPYHRRIERMLVRLRWLMGLLWLAAYAGYIVALFVFPDSAAGAEPAANDSGGFGYGFGATGSGESGFPLIPTVMGVTSVLFAAAGVQYFRLLRRRDSAIVVSLIVGAILFTDSQVFMMLTPLWNLSWWIYHVLLLAGFSVVAYALVLEFRRTRQVADLFDGLRVREAVSRVADNYNEATLALVAAVEAKDPYTRGHSAWVADYSTDIATELRLPGADVERVRNAAVLHDIGKISVAEQVLSKKGPLNDAELDAVRAHPAAGHTIVESISSLHPCIPGIRHHHEWMNGSGYPDGIRGKSIHMDARIIAVADVFDALTSERSYRDAWSSERAREILVAESGDHFDPAVVDAFLQANIDVPEEAIDPGLSPVEDGA